MMAVVVGGAVNACMNGCVMLCERPGINPIQLSTPKYPQFDLLHVSLGQMVQELELDQFWHFMHLSTIVLHMYSHIRAGDLWPIPINLAPPNTSRSRSANWPLICLCRSNSSRDRASPSLTLYMSWYLWGWKKIFAHL